MCSAQQAVVTESRRSARARANTRVERILVSAHLAPATLVPQACLWSRRQLGAKVAGDSGVADRVREYLKGSDEGPAVEAAAVSVAALAAAALSLFAQLNWTGPPLPPSPEGGARASRCAASREASEEALAALEVEGEQPYALLRALSLLLAARRLLLEPLGALQAAEADGCLVGWWAARCAQLHQRCLSDCAPSLERLATRCMRSALDALRAGGGRRRAACRWRHSDGRGPGGQAGAQRPAGRDQVVRRRGRAGTASRWRAATRCSSSAPTCSRPGTQRPVALWAVSAGRRCTSRVLSAGPLRRASFGTVAPRPITAV